MIEIKLLNDNSEVITYNFERFPILSKKLLLSEYPNMAAPNHWHDDIEFIIILEGKMSYSVNGKSYELKKGQAIFVNSAQMHYGYSCDGSECNFICIILNPLILSEITLIKESYIIPICTDTSHPFFIFDPSIGWQKDFIEQLIKIYKFCSDKQDGFQLQVMSNLYSIFYSLYHNIKNSKDSQEYYYDKNLDSLHNMIGYIQRNYKNKITLKEIASSGNVCRSNCCEIFQSILNKSPISYLIEYRLNKSIKLLNDTSYTITEIALKCGFNSSSYFTEIFHKQLGCTPSQYRKNNANKAYEDIMNIFTQLKNTKNLTNNEKQIVDFILDNPNAFLDMSLEQICKECFVSTTTLYRLCRKLNLSGLSDLKVKMSGSVNSYLKENRDFDFDFPVKQNQSHYEILTRIREDYDQTLLSTFNLFNLEQLRLAVNAMKKAKQIDVYTSAGNIYFAENFKFQMQEIGITINVPVEEYNQMLVAACSNETHLAIVISFGGRGFLVDKIAKTLKKNGTSILLISSTEDNPIKEYVNYQLHLCSNENHYNKISSFSTRLSLLYILDILFACYFKTDYDNNLKKKLLYYKKMCEF